MQPDSPSPMPDALRQVEAALQDAHQSLESLAGCLPNRICVYGAYGEHWSENPQGDEYEVVDFAVSIEMIEAARSLLPALAQQIVEMREAVLWAYQLAGAAKAGERAMDNLSAIGNGRSAPHLWMAAECGEFQRAERAEADLAKTREALAVAEGALDCAGCYCAESYQCRSCKALARIAALKGAPTGTPKGEAE